jgi:hypothetical protein
MATKSFSRDIIVTRSEAIQLLRTSMKEGASLKERKVTPKGSKTVSATQVKSILQEF